MILFQNKSYSRKCFYICFLKHTSFNKFKTVCQSKDKRVHYFYFKNLKSNLFQCKKSNKSLRGNRLVTKSAKMPPRLPITFFPLTTRQISTISKTFHSVLSNHILPPFLELVNPEYANNTFSLYSIYTKPKGS